MAKRIQPLTVAEAAAAYDQVEITWRHADDWCRALEHAFTAVLEQHTAIGRRLNDAIKPMLQGDPATEDMGALWAEEARLREQMHAVMACRRAAAKRRNTVWELLGKADRAYDRALSRSRRAA